MTDNTELLIRLDEWLGIGKVWSDALLVRDIKDAANVIRALEAKAFVLQTKAADTAMFTAVVNNDRIEELKTLIKAMGWKDE